MILSEINELIEEEHGTPIIAEQAIVESGVDSFGLLMILNTINIKYSVWINEEFAKIDFSKISPLDIERKINENKQLQVLS